jgi:purine-cytosine permease-like protein
MRMLIGGGFAGIGGLNLYCSFMIDNSAVEGDFILIGNVIALVVILSTIIGAKFRGFLEHIPVPPLVIFPSLIGICLYAATY